MPESLSRRLAVHRSMSILATLASQQPEAMALLAYAFVHSAHET
jgi:hypothetical protein